jgi:hypothetical protein
LGRDAQPSASSSDSQSVKTSGVGGVRGFESGKKGKGRNRQMLVDTEGLVLHEPVLQMDFPRRRHIWLDSAYNGKGTAKDWIEETLGWTAECVAHRRRASKEWILAYLPADQAAQLDWSTVLPVELLRPFAMLGGRKSVCLAKPATPAQQG